MYYNDFWKCLNWRVRSIAASRLTKNSPPDCFCLYEAVPYLPNSTGFTGICFWEALHELDAVFYRCNFCCNDNQYDLCDTLFL